MTEAGGLIAAAIIAGAVTFFSLIISKEQSVSEFRQQWIDALRKDISIIVGCVISIHGDSITRAEDEALWSRVKSDFTRFNRVIARIRLRLNPKESEKKEEEATKAVLNTLQELEDLFAARTPQFHKLQPLVDSLVVNSQTILKANWDRVREGEPIYKRTKIGGLILAVAGSVIYLIYKLIC